MMASEVQMVEEEKRMVPVSTSLDEDTYGEVDKLRFEVIGGVKHEKYKMAEILRILVPMGLQEYKNKHGLPEKEVA